MTLADQENQTQNQNQDQNKDQNQTPPETPEKSSRRKFIVIAVLILLVIGGGLFYWHSTFSEDTDDAQVDGDLYEVSSRVTGQVIKVYVQDNQTVQAGQAIADIDPKDYQVAFDQAQANLASAEADYEQAHVNVPITSVSSRTTIDTSGSDVTASSAAVAQAEKQKEAADARVVEAKANALKAQLDVERYTPLVQKDVISKQQYDQAVATANADTAAVLGAQADVIAAQEAVRQAQQKVAQSRFQAQQAAKNGPQQVKAQEARAESMLASVKQAQAKLEQARLNLSYCKIVAPVAGIVSKKNVDVGVNVSIGQDLLTVVPVTNLWVTANFKETQLDKMKPGQEVKLEVDALGGRKFSGKVTQIGGATGSRLSLFPPENATGNYVKVVQRIPVRIDFTNLDKENGDYALRPGFSVTPIVTVK
ncbi:HlyD family secretion protein [Granulicella aggregans]|jgi:membrane fusion protein (multidrug efflux system)|uniref:HlyD family secretion protein n=1 Tax=Granulicella aggregans TaxID=474949 RepID=UPI0021E06C8E|nr:HlyD family secretion protein [Granulicella aggregans]